MSSFTLRGLYAITDGGSGKRLVEQVEAAVNAGIALLQYRNKNLDADLRRREAMALLAICRRAAVPLIINDDVMLAAEIGADGVHLGRDDASLEKSRNLLGEAAIIGISCYDDFDRALNAERRGADYVAFGRFFPSTTKPNAVQASLGLLQRGAKELSLPMVAIGGITPENGAALVTAGADMLAVVEALFAKSDITQACAEFHQLFAEN